VISSCQGRIGGAGRSPTIGARIVSPAGVQKIRARITEASAPDDHFAVCPDCRVKPSGLRRVGGGGGGCPTVRAGIIPATGVYNIGVVKPAPDDHFVAGPDCCVIGYSGRISGAGCCPAIGARVVSPAATVGDISTPDDHFATRPHCRVTVSSSGRVGVAGGRPTVAARVIPCAVKINGTEEVSAPDDHFATRPYCRVKPPGVGRVPREYSRPTVSAGIVSPAGVADDHTAIDPAPDDHFAARPHCCVCGSSNGRLVGDAGGRPTIGSRIVSPASVQSIAAIGATPDDHFAAGPHCRVRGSGRRGVDGADVCPGVIHAPGPASAISLGMWLSATDLQDFNNSLSWAERSVTNRSDSAGLAKHSAMIKGSFPSAAKSSRSTSGCLVCCAMRSISACNWSVLIGTCESSSACELRR